jgi:glycine cleavage system H protein
MNIPVDLKYTGSDEWVRIEGNVATIGVTDFAQSQLSDIVYFELKVDAGDVVKKGAAVATMESVKAAADVSTPVSGKIIEVNENLGDDFEKINTDPYGAAWMVKVELSNPAEVADLMGAAAYQKSCEERGH